MTPLATLLDDAGILALLVRGGASPAAPRAFEDRVKALVTEFAAAARTAGHDESDVEDMVFAIQALLDESVEDGHGSRVKSASPDEIVVRAVAVDAAPAGFFERLARLRAEEDPRLDVLEVFHRCLVLGYRGAYRFEGPEKLRYIASSLGQDIARLRGSRAAFAPSALPTNAGASEGGAATPWWRFVAIAVAVTGTAWFGYTWLLHQRTEAVLASVRALLAP